MMNKDQVKAVIERYMLDLSRYLILVGVLPKPVGEITVSWPDEVGPDFVVEESK